MGLGIAVGELAILGAASVAAFEYGRRQEIKLRDGYCCQMAGCRCGRHLTIHHVVPESVVKERSYARNGIYNDWIYQSYKLLRRRVGGERNWNLYRDDIRGFVTDSENAVTLCEFHHSALHSDTLETVELRDNPRHLSRPAYLSVPYATAILVASIEDRLMADGFDPDAIWVEIMERGLEVMKEGDVLHGKVRNPVMLEKMSRLRWEDFSPQATEYSTPIKSIYG